MQLSAKDGVGAKVQSVDGSVDIFSMIADGPVTCPILDQRLVNFD